MKSNKWFESINTNPVIKGSGVPTSAAEKGQLYADTTNAVLYINTDGATAWQDVSIAAIEKVITSGEGEPSGDAPIGHLYVDITNGVLYINTDGSTWVFVGDQAAT